VSRIHLRNRVRLLAVAFALLLITITFTLSWRAKQSQERWSRLVGVETEAVATLEELVRAQNAFRAQIPFDDPRAPERYKAVEQLLDRPALEEVEATALRVRMHAFRQALEQPELRGEAAQESVRVSNEAHRLADSRKAEIRRQLPVLEREARATMVSGLATVWIVVVLSLLVVLTTVRNVVRPLERVADAADRIANGDMNTVAPVEGDEEIARVGSKLNEMAEKLKAYARTDDLTGLPNFRAFRERIDSEIALSARYDMTFGILVLDLDRFKNYNDTYGHLAGNEALQRVAQAVRGAVRQVDFPARYGGEEFAVIMPKADVTALAHVAERIRAHVEALPAPPDGAQVTLSIGAAAYPADGITPEALFQVADERLYEAKREGRNRVVVTTARVARSAG
jgi:diguanylate cyclase (GGDEF)-like protein